MAMWETTTIGPFRIAAVPAVDALGDPQVSWAVEPAAHACSTWRQHVPRLLVARRPPVRPLRRRPAPINGPTLCFPHCQRRAPIPAALDAEQRPWPHGLLGAKVALPIHYDGFHIDGIYHTQPAELSRYLDATSTETYAVLTPSRAMT